MFQALRHLTDVHFETMAEGLFAKNVLSLFRFGCRVNPCSNHCCSCASYKAARRSAPYARTGASRRMGISVRLHSGSLTFGRARRIFGSRSWPTRSNIATVISSADPASGGASSSPQVQGDTTDGDPRPPRVRTRAIHRIAFQLQPKSARLPLTESPGTLVCAHWI